MELHKAEKVETLVSETIKTMEERGFTVEDALLFRKRIEMQIYKNVSLLRKTTAFSSTNLPSVEEK